MEFSDSEAEFYSEPDSSTESSESSQIQSESDSESDEFESAAEEEVEEEESSVEQSSCYSSDYDDSLDEGPYSDEPLANEEWLNEYNQERKEIEERWQELQSRLDGSVTVDTWCRCGNCQVTLLQNPKECQCCHEIDGCMESLEIELVLKEIEKPPNCVTLHPGFSAVCLNHWSLRSSAAKYKTIDGRKYQQTGTEDQFLRATAYREFTQLVHGYLGNAKRIPLPACVYDVIRAEFPCEDNYTGYEDSE